MLQTLQIQNNKSKGATVNAVPCEYLIIKSDERYVYIEHKMQRIKKHLTFNDIFDKIRGVSEIKKHPGKDHVPGDHAPNKNKVGEWKRSDGTVISDQGENFVNKKFANDEKTEDHIARHKDDYKNITDDEYIKGAWELAKSSVGGNIIGFSTSEGYIVRYNKKTKDFVKADPGKNGCIKTRMVPHDKDVYYHNEKKNTWRFRKGGNK